MASDLCGMGARTLQRRREAADALGQVVAGQRLDLRPPAAHRRELPSWSGRAWRAARALKTHMNMASLQLWCWYKMPAGSGGRTLISPELDPARLRPQGRGLRPATSERTSPSCWWSNCAMRVIARELVASRSPRHPWIQQLTRHKTEITPASAAGTQGSPKLLCTYRGFKSKRPGVAP